MFGRLLSKTIRVVTLPLDAANAAADIATGGDGSKRSRNQFSPLAPLEELRDVVADTAEDIDS